MDDLHEPSVPSVSAEEVKNAMDSHEEYILLDVRTSGEYERGKLEGSINIPLDRVACDVQAAIPKKDTKIYVYCLSGSRSVHAVAVMKELGYTDVFDVNHGLLAWRVKGFPVV